LESGEDSLIHERCPPVAPLASLQNFELTFLTRCIRSSRLKAPADATVLRTLGLSSIAWTNIV